MRLSPPFSDQEKSDGGYVIYKHTMQHISLIMMVAVCLCAETAVIDFNTWGDAPQGAVRSAAASLSNNGSARILSVRFRPGDEYAAIYLTNASGWDLSRFQTLSITLKNCAADAAVSVSVRSTSGKSYGERSGSQRIRSQESRTMTVDLTASPVSDTLKASDLFGMKGAPFGLNKPFYPARVTNIVVFLEKPASESVIEIVSITADGQQHPQEIPQQFFPFVDEFGQWKHDAWPGKINVRDDLVLAYEKEKQSLESSPRPSSWNRYGGWNDGPAFRATGNFYAEKTNGRWCLVDPDGRSFFSMGITCVQHGDETVIDDRAHWFERLPEDAAYRALYSEHKSSMKGYYYEGRKVKTFPFFRYNLMNKYGENWGGKFYETSSRRIMSWGMNTIGNWSSPDIYLLRKVPYTVALSTRAPAIAGSTGYWGLFKDVFHPDFKENLKKLAGGPAVKNTVDDPWCIGYFVDNEISWGDETSLALGTLASPATQEAKKVFIADLKKKYGGIDAVNSAWGMSYVSWEGMLAATNVPAKEKAFDDLTSFNAKIASTYFETIRDVLKDAAPKQLYLGCRFAWANSMVVQAASRFCDVVSFNIYEYSPNDSGHLAAVVDKPVLIGEFHFGVRERGYTYGGMRIAGSQQERAGAFKKYVLDAIDNPNIVGCHWFQYVDCPLTGRWLDGANAPVGFVDNTDTPYGEMVAASREIGALLYPRLWKK